MDDTGLCEINARIEAASDEAFKALLALERFRQAADPDMRRAYRHVHRLITDLAAVRAHVGILHRTGDGHGG